MLQWLRDWLERRAYFRRALAFNRRYTYRTRNPQWMCPTCHGIHNPYATSAFSGLQYPECCGFEAGHRLDRRHATGLK
jgi:hypothetical protein